MTPSPDTLTPHDHDRDRARRILRMIRLELEREVVRLIPDLQPTPELIGSAEIAGMLGIQRSSLSRWRRQHPDFPDPVYGDRPGGRPRWRRQDVLTWLSRTRHDESRGEGRS